MTHDQLIMDAQSVLNDLWKEKLIPFQLTAYEVESLGPLECTIRFYDSRLHSLVICLQKHQSFKDAFRVSWLALEGVEGPWRMSA